MNTASKSAKQPLHIARTYHGSQAGQAKKIILQLFKKTGNSIFQLFCKTDAVIKGKANFLAADFTHYGTLAFVELCGLELGF